VLKVSANSPVAYTYLLQGAESFLRS